MWPILKNQFKQIFQHCTWGIHERPWDDPCSILPWIVMVKILMPCSKDLFRLDRGFCRPSVIKRGWKIPHVRWFSTQSPIKTSRVFGDFPATLITGGFMIWFLCHFVGYWPLFQQTLPFPSPLVVLPKLSSASAFNFGISWLSEDEICNIQTPKRWCSQWKWCFFVTPLVRSTAVAS